MKKLISKYFMLAPILLSILSFPALSNAAEDSAFAEKARTRQYPGGADESDLKVQQVVAAVQKTKAEASQESNEGF
ncbi:MAG: hypothetical protein H7061_04345 [Bdellovibrionaceae bacterium]|nr:hypothetical protein [Bdellovibrio sp.]